MTGYLTFYDAAWPPDPPPATDGVAIYIGGDAVHVWTAEEIGMQPARYRLPVFVRSSPRGIAGVAADVNAALRQLAAIKAPRGILVAWDMETAAGKLYIAGVYAGMAAHGYRLIIYGSQSDVMGNDVPDDLYWGADWTGTAHLHKGDAITQWVSFAGFDLDLAEPSLPFWDTQAGPPEPPAKPAAPASPPVPAWQEAMMRALPQVRLGDSGEHVRTVQGLCIARGHQVAVDGDFGPATHEAVAAVQAAARIAQDGVVGEATWPALAGV